jgi:periplasmic protein TonB
MNLFAQESGLKEDNNVYSSAGLDYQPEYPGGMKNFGLYLSTNYNAPNIKGLKGKVIVEFVVEKDGSLVDIKVIKDIGFGTGVEAVRVLKECPLWKPAMHNGNVVRVRYSLPINVDVK